jgi:hypothetical protein
MQPEPFYQFDPTVLHHVEPIGGLENQFAIGRVQQSGLGIVLLLPGDVLVGPPYWPRCPSSHQEFFSKKMDIPAPTMNPAGKKCRCRCSI